MSEKCEVCGRKVPDFQDCDHIGSAPRFGGVSNMFTSNKLTDSTNALLGEKPQLLLVAPFAGLLLDLVLPFWSSFWISLLMAIAGTFLFHLVRSLISFKNFNVAYAIQSALLLDLFKNRNQFSNFASSLMLRLGALLVAVLAIVAIGTPANLSGLSSEISKGIQEQTGKNFTVKCPNTLFIVSGTQITCEVDAVFTLTVPANVEITDFFGNFSWQVDLGIL